MLHGISPAHTFSQEEVITFASLAWLPGPEGVMMFADGAVAEICEEGSENENSYGYEDSCGNKDSHRYEDGKPFEDSSVEKRESIGNERKAPLGITVFLDSSDYRPPSWARGRGFDVIYTARCSGKGGLCCWERGEEIVSGIRGVTGRLVRRAAGTRTLEGYTTGALRRNEHIRRKEEVVIEGDKNGEVVEGSSGRAQVLEEVTRLREDQREEEVQIDEEFGFESPDTVTSFRLV